ncbi:CLUMA_CG014548, isoform A [Clunio marinus]|uniref:CLUMA_CG014548, isoform A n=1 Tax=Clunio marinus TaxID=568069 RepID=A0A1J1ING4_9DIPT|nr:CLUMA_CG014548, isoform A [Clunio marinus]
MTKDCASIRFIFQWNFSIFLSSSFASNHRQRNADIIEVLQKDTRLVEWHRSGRSYCFTLISKLNLCFVDSASEGKKHSNGFMSEKYFLRIAYLSQQSNQRQQICHSQTAIRNMQAIGMFGITKEMFIRSTHPPPSNHHNNSR